MNNYTSANKRVYDKIASDYDLNNVKWKASYARSLKPFELKMKNRFGEKASILDIGCGPGLEMEIMAGHGFKLYGMDISPIMVTLARKNIPKAKFTVGNLLTKKIGRKFDGIVMLSSFHLFAIKDIPKVLNRLDALTKPGAYIFIAIPTSEGRKRTVEGYLGRTNYRGGTIKRFSVRWSQKDLKKIFSSIAWTKICSLFIKKDKKLKSGGLGITWFNIILQKYDDN